MVDDAYVFIVDPVTKMGIELEKKRSLLWDGE